MPLTKPNAPGPKHQALIIHTDGGSRGNPGPAATGIVIYDVDGREVYGFGKYIGITTNNVAEYSAVIHALEWLTTDYSNPLPSQLLFKLDSKLVVEQISRRWKIKEVHLYELATKIWDLIIKHHLNVSFNYVPRIQNSTADSQVNQALDNHKID